MKSILDIYNKIYNMHACLLQHCIRKCVLYMGILNTIGFELKIKKEKKRTKQKT